MTPPLLSISKSIATQFFIVDFWIDSDAVLLLISESAAAQFAADFWIDSDTVFVADFESAATQSK